MDQLKAKAQSLLNMPLFKLLRETFNEWNEDKAPRLAAALAYYTAFSLAPMLIVAISIAGLIFGQDAVRGRVQTQIQGAVGSQAAGAIQEMLVNFHHPDTNVIATVIGVATLLLGAAGLFGQLQDALDTIWEVAPKPGQGLMATIRQRFLSFTMVLGIGFVLLVSMVISAVLAAVSTWISNTVPGQEVWLPMVNTVVSFIIIMLLFAAIYKVLPDAEISWRDVWMGAAVTSLLFTLGKFALGWYLGKSSIASGYGAAGSFVVLLLWIYYSAQILLFGAEFTQVYARTYGSKIQPSKNAVWLREDQRVSQGIPRKEDVKAKAAADLPPVPEVPRMVTPEQQRIARQPEGMPQSHLGAVILGICAALASFLVGMLIKTDQRQRSG